MELGEEIGRGVRSVVYAYGDDAAKVPNPDVPRSWLVEELRLTDAVARAGAGVAGRRRLVDVDRSTAFVAERIVGPSMWQQLATEPERASDYAVELARIQDELARCRPSFELPAQRDRIVSKVYLAAQRYGDDLLGALDHLPADEGPLVTCHGDLHPRNVLVATGGTVLVDWFDANRGAIAGDIARTLVILEDSRELDVPSERPRDDAIATFRDTYVAAARELAGVDAAALEPWLLVQRVARLAEGLGSDRIDALRQSVRAERR